MHSLLDRFQGCFEGMVLGEQLGSLAQTGQFSHRWQPEPTDPGCWSQIALQLAGGIVRSQTWNLAMLDHTKLRQIPRSELTSGALAIVTLPIALFFHDDLNRQRQALWQVVEALQRDEAKTWVTVFAYAIAQALRNQFDPSLFVVQTEAYLRVLDLEQPAVLRSVASVQSLALVHLASLEPNADATIAIALSRLLQTPNALSLALLRSARIRHSQPILSALTGALAGAYNGVAGIPASWRLVGSPASSLPHLHQLAAHLLAVWSGVYNWSDLSEVTALAVAAPWISRST